MIANLSTYWRGMANGTRTGIIARGAILLLAPVSALYSLAVRLRAALYSRALLQTRHLPRPVISVGNITVGGTGKTPVTAYIAALLLRQGLRVAVLSRGYGGSMEGKVAMVSDGTTVVLEARECGDEPFLLASTVPGLMVVIGSDRHAAGLLAIRQLSPDILLLDDGFQHLRLHRDLNILLLDSAHPYGNGRTLPAGLLREPVSAAERADLVIHTRCPEGAAGIVTPAGIPGCRAGHRITDALSLVNRLPTPLSLLTGKKVIAFAGLGEPELFFDELRSHGLSLVHTISFPDHTTYDRGDVDLICKALQRYSADTLITTEKDGVKLGGLPPDVAGCVMLARLELVMENPAILNDHLRNLLQKKS